MKIHTFKGVFRFLFSSALVIFNAGFSAVNYFDPGNKATIPPMLSQTGIYTGKTITTEAIQYDVNVPQWTDSIRSFRYVLVKAPGKIVYNDTAEYYGYPENVIFVRTLYYNAVKGNPASQKFLETRLLVKSPGKQDWVPINYQWNTEQTDAKFVEEYIESNYTITNAAGTQTNRWQHDDSAFCVQCHTGHGVNGFITAQLNRPSPVNPLENQLKYLFDKGVFLSAPPTSYTTLPKWAPPTDTSATFYVRTHSYIAAQCSQCHSARRGLDDALDMYFDYHRMEDYSYIEKTAPPNVKPLLGLDSLILYSTPQVIEGCEDARMIYKGDPGASYFFYRMTQRTENLSEYFYDALQMPPATSFFTDTDAIALFKKWICNMDPVMCALPAGQKKAGSDHVKCPDIVVDFPSEGNSIPDNIKRNRTIPYSPPLIKNRVLHIPDRYATGTHAEVFMTGINGKEKRLTRVGKGLFKIDASVSAGVYVFRINEYSFKKVVF